jgi:putative CocE/NonD family hydrolase
MDDDQRFASRRPDVLTYTSAVLTEDVTIAGPVTPTLHITSTGTDSDFVVKLIDVYPYDFPNTSPADSPVGKRILGAPPVLMGGYQQLVRGEPFRAKFRNSWEKPEPLKPGEPTVLKFDMPDVNHTFRKGHRIMVQVQSSWFPLVDRNPQTFTDIPKAKPEQFVKATETILTGGDNASGVQVLVLPQP